VLAVAQLVYTATSIPGAIEVRLAIEGHPIDAARGDGSLSNSPVRPSDYPGLAPG
jgi:spore germination protein GerM